MGSENKDDKGKDKRPNPFGDFKKNNDSKTPQQQSMFKNMLIWLVLVAVSLSLYAIYFGGPKLEGTISYTEYKSFLDKDLIKSAKIIKSSLNDFEFRGELKQKVTINIEGRPREILYFNTKLGLVDSEIEKIWNAKNIYFTYEQGDNAWWSAIVSLLPFLLLIGLYVFFLRRMQGGGGGGGSKGIFSFGKSKAKMLGEGGTKILFTDVAGADEAKFELVEVIEFLKEPNKFQRLGGKIPKGVLLLGPPGTGKTLLARAVAGEANVPFFSISGADFVEMFVGVGASRVRDLFDQAMKNAPCIVFIDEIDAVGRHRGAGVGGGHDEREQTLNQLLVEMDGFEQNNGIIIIAATNRPDVLDPALLRPGRFDRQVVVDRPDVKGREGIFKVHTKKVPLAADVDVEVLAKGTPGMSGADIANVVNEAALLAARRNGESVSMFDFENAKDKILMGVERKSMVISIKEKEMTAYHEMGHALVGTLLTHADPIHKVTIIPRGRALGITSYLPSEDHHSYSKEYIDAQIVMLLAGRAAEKLVFDNLTTGASNDLQRATKLAKKMVCEWGMSEVIGPVTYTGQHEEVFLGREIGQPVDHSEQTAQLIDSEVRKILLQAGDKAENLLRENIDILHKTSKVLLERETIDGEELNAIIRGEDLPPITKQTLSALRSFNFDKDGEQAKN